MCSCTSKVWLFCKQGWIQSGQSARWAQEMGLDMRGLRFARDVQKQLVEIAGSDGRALLADDSRPAKGITN